jgi:hypothetical protein
MKVEVVYKSDKKEVVHSLSAYPDLYLCIIANPARGGGERYLRLVEVKRRPIPVVITRMFREAPFGYLSQREARFLPRDVEVKGLIHPLLLEPFPDELNVVGCEVLMRRKVGGKEVIYEGVLGEAEEPGFPLMEGYSIEVDGEKEKFRFKDLSV